MPYPTPKRPTVDEIDVWETTPKERLDIFRKVRNCPHLPSVNYLEFKVKWIDGRFVDETDPFVLEYRAKASAEHAKLEALRAIRHGRMALPDDFTYEIEEIIATWDHYTSWCDYGTVYNWTECKLFYPRHPEYEDDTIDEPWVYIVDEGT